jgi:hypothetical protein
MLDQLNILILVLQQRDFLEKQYFAKSMILEYLSHDYGPEKLE